jgi:hypothetical protein
MTLSKKSPFKIGDWVQSHYRGRWKGRVIAIQTLKNPSYYDNGSEFEVCVCVPEFSKANNPIRKARPVTLHPCYLKGIDVPTNG